MKGPLTMTQQQPPSDSAACSDPGARVIDARWLAPPEPMELTLAALDDLGDGDELILLIHREPRPLYDVLRRNGYRHRVEMREDASFAIHIRKVGGA